MRIVIYLLGILLMLFGVSTNISAQVTNDNEDGVYKIPSHNAKDIVPGQVLVKFKDANRIQIRRAAGKVSSTSSSPLTEMLQKYGDVEMEQLLPNENPNRQMRRSKAYNGDIIQEHDLSQLYLINIKEGDAQGTMEMVNDLQALDEVEYAEPNYKVYIMADDNIAADYSSNPFVSQQWYLDAYGVKELWNKPIINSERPVIAIIDTGVDITHPDLKDNIWTNMGEVDGSADRDNDSNGFKNDVHGWDFINNTPKMRDSNMHGTHVAGIAAAANNGVGIVGANPKALIMPITTLQSDGIGDNATLIKGINYAVDNGATIINMSLGTYGNSQALRQALENAYHSAVIVAAAGNDHRCIYASHKMIHQDIPPMPCFPAAYSFVLGVQATTSFGDLATFSNYDDDGPLTSCESTILDPDGFNYELKAPGTNILSTIPGGNYRQLQGTSMASPLVAGAVSALMMVKQYDNQEILWADLLHSDNISGAYHISNRPAELEITRIVLRDRNEQAKDGEKYYDVNVGETINIYPHIRTSFGSASNIKLTIEVPSEVEVSIGEADFGYNLDVYGKMIGKNPLVIKVPDDMPNASTIDVTVKATCNESNKTFSKTFTLHVANMYTLKGMLTEDMTLTPEHVYYVSGQFGVSKGYTLTIKPGTRLEFAKDAGLYAFGTLNAKGTPEAPIVFTSYDNSQVWSGVYSHIPDGKHEYNGIYTNTGQTLFTLLPTEDTPIEMSNLWQSFYYDTEENKPQTLYFTNYYDNWNYDMTGKEALLTDPNFLTPTILKMMDDWNGYFQKCSTERTAEMNNNTYVGFFLPSWSIYTNPKDTLTYCRIDGFYGMDTSSSWDGGVNINNNPYYVDCVVQPTRSPYGGRYPYIEGLRNVVAGTEGILNSIDINSKYTNCINNTLGYRPQTVSSNLKTINFFNNLFIDPNTHKAYMLQVVSTVPETVKIDPLPYLGSTREDLLRPLIYEYGNTDGLSDINKSSTYATLDLSNITKQPYHEAHGIVWKVLVNGKDAQDEQEELLPLGVGKYKFEVYFNRPMNKAVEPQISFGVIAPYDQHPVAEDASWNADGTIYTAYITIDGKTQSDGMNRIYVRGAEDNEFFPCPYEATRFNIMVQAVGSMASGFQAEPGLGCVKLTWNNENNDFEDAMGFNVYRFNPEVTKTIPGHYDEHWKWIDEQIVVDTVRINETILDISATSYIDDNVTPGQTYYYYYKVLSTALQEYDVSNVVAATPLTAIRGDANGSGDVDVADVITTVNYITGLQPKPFVFDAADMNSDKLIDIFDVVGIVRGILNPSLLATASLNDESAVYFVEDGVLYVESPVTLGGVQVQLTVDGRGRMEDVRVDEDLDGFEQASAWLSDDDYLFLAYSLNGKILTPGKHALLYIGDAEISSLRLSDTAGKNVNVSNDDGTTGIDRMGKHVMNVNGVYDLQGRKLSSDTPLKKGIYIINGSKVVK